MAPLGPFVFGLFGVLCCVCVFYCLLAFVDGSPLHGGNPPLKFKELDRVEPPSMLISRFLLHGLDVQWKRKRQVREQLHRKSDVLLTTS